MASVADAIDMVFGVGVTAQLDYRKTMIIGDDKVIEWIDAQRVLSDEARTLRGNELLNKSKSAISF